MTYKRFLIVKETTLYLKVFSRVSVTAESRVAFRIKLDKLSLLQDLFLIFYFSAISTILPNLQSPLYFKFGAINSAEWYLSLSTCYRY